MPTAAPDPIAVEKLRRIIRDVPDFPKPGILFKDITPLLADPETHRLAIDLLAARYRAMPIDLVLGVESRGFLFASPLAYVLGAGMVIVRKPGKLPWKAIRETYALEYGTDTLEIHQDAIAPGQRVLLVDDLLATGGTIAAAARMVRAMGGVPVEAAFVVELDFLDGRKKLGDLAAYSLVHY
jgi:adenine phosphoribosyltransferase